MCLRFDKLGVFLREFEVVCVVVDIDDSNLCVLIWFGSGI